MAFNIDIPGPKLINTGFSQQLSELGETIGGIRKDAEVRESLANLDWNDPASVDSFKSKLFGLGPKYADLAVRIMAQQEAAKNQAEQRRLQERGLDLQSRGVTVREGEFQRGLTADKTAAERYKAVQDALRTGPPIPAEDTEPPAKPGSESQPTTYTPGSRAVQERFPQGTPTDDSLWDLRVGPQSALPDPTEIPQDVSAAARGPQYAQAPAATMTDAGPTGPTSPRPTPPEQEGLGLRQPTAREKAIAARINWLQGIANQAAGTEQEKAIDKQITFLGAELKELRTSRQKALEKQEAAVLARENRAAAVEEGPKKEMLTESIKASGPREQAQATLGRMWELSTKPDVVTGEYGADVASRAKKMAEIQQSLKAYGLEGVVPQFIKDFAKRTTYDPGMRYEEFKSLSQQLVQARTADKVFDKLSNDDRKALERSVPSEEDPPQVQQSKVAMLWAYEDRKADIAKIRMRGINAGLNTAQIEENVTKFNQKYSLTQDSKEKLVQLREQSRGATAPAPTTTPAQTFQAPPPEAIKDLFKNRSPERVKSFIKNFGQDTYDKLIQQYGG